MRNVTKVSVTKMSGDSNRHRSVPLNLDAYCISDTILIDLFKTIGVPA